MSKDILRQNLPNYLARFNAANLSRMCIVKGLNEGTLGLVGTRFSKSKHYTMLSGLNQSMINKGMAIIVFAKILIKTYFSTASNATSLYRLRVGNHFAISSIGCVSLVTHEMMGQPAFEKVTLFVL